MKSFSLTSVASFVTCLTQVSAHGHVQEIRVDGIRYVPLIQRNKSFPANLWSRISYGGYLPQLYNNMTDPPKLIAWSTTVPDDGFVNGTGYAGPNIICHENAKPGALTAPVKAGGTIEMLWTPWPDGHHGPVLSYLANCNGNCSAVNKTELQWFKIEQQGLINFTAATTPGFWASDLLTADNNTWTFQIPEDIKPGNYVLRHEIIALQYGYEVDGAQNYPQCINLQISGSGTVTANTTLGEQLYTPTQPGILFEIWRSNITTYPIPGPPMPTNLGTTA